MLGKFCLNIKARIASHRVFSILAPLLFYCALSFAFFGNTRSWTHRYFGYMTDPISFIWFLNWWPFAIVHHLNPFICEYVWFPKGYNFSWATAVPSLALLSWPITALGGPVLSFNILTLLAPALGAWGAFLLGREISRSYAAALVGGFLFGFSAPEYNELLAELNLDTIVLIPLAVLLCVRRARGSLAQKPFIFLLTLLLVVQIGISTEVLTTLCIMGALSWVIFLLFAPEQDRPGYLFLARDISIAAPFVILLASPFFYYLLRGLPDVPKIINSPYFASSELINFLIPGSSTHSWRSAILSIAHEFYGFRPDNGTYIGFPLFLVLIWYFASRINFSYVRALLATTFAIAILSLGPVLHLNGVVTSITMPWTVAMQLPIIREILPGRLLTYVTLCTSIAATCWLAESGSVKSKAFRFAVAGISCWLLVPFKPVNLTPPWAPEPIMASQHNFKWSPWPNQSFFTPGNVLAELGPKSNVLILPASIMGPGMAWQLNSGMGFKQSIAYVGFAPLREQNNAIVNEIIFGTAGPNFQNDFSAYCVMNDINFILIGPDTRQSFVAAIDALKWPETTEGGIKIVRVPDQSKLKFLFVQGDYWPSSSLNWMGKGLTIVSGGKPLAITLSVKYWPFKNPVRIGAETRLGRVNYEMGQGMSQTIDLPADEMLKLTANKTFVPDHIFHNGDLRKLSVSVIGLSPGK